MKTKLTNAFTIVELLVAMGLVVILVGLSSLIFATGVKAHRTADSTVEIVRRTESISRQLVADIGGLRIDAPLAVWFERDPATGKRYDQILFFANGNFQTMRQYNGSIARGNLARIYYGHALQVETDAAGNPVAETASYQQSGFLARRTHLLTSDMTLTYPGVPSPFPNPLSAAQFGATFVPYANNHSEYDQLSLAEWKNLMLVAANCNHFLLRNFFYAGASPDFEGRPMIDMAKIDTLHLLLAERISELKVQWGYKSQDLVKVPATGEPFSENETFAGLRWWPEADASDIADFGPMGMNGSLFGVYFNMPGVAVPPSNWFPAEVCRTSLTNFTSDYYPRALKITFTVHDTKGLYPDGRTFTQVVSLE